MPQLERTVYGADGKLGVLLAIQQGEESAFDVEVKTATIYAFTDPVQGINPDDFDRPARWQDPRRAMINFASRELFEFKQTTKPAKNIGHWISLRPSATARISQTHVIYGGIHRRLQASRRCRTYCRGDMKLNCSITGPKTDVA